MNSLCINKIAECVIRLLGLIKKLDQVLELKGLGASRGKLSIHCVLFSTPFLDLSFLYIYTTFLLVNIRSRLHGGNTSLSSISFADSHRH